MRSVDPDIRYLMALRAVEGRLLRLKWLAAATRFELAMVRHDRALKANFNPSEPRVPAGNPDGGQWTTGGGSSGGGSSRRRAPGSGGSSTTGGASAPAAGSGRSDPRALSDVTPDNHYKPGKRLAQNDPASPTDRSNHTNSKPTDVVLPDGSKIPDSQSPTGYLRSPVADLSAVARAGRKTAADVRSLLKNPDSAFTAAEYLALKLKRDLGQGGNFDYQRDSSEYRGEYRNVSNFNVGLYCQQAGLTLDETRTVAGAYAKLFSNNPGARDTYGLTNEQRRFIDLGYRAGQSGTFGSSP